MCRQWLCLSLLLTFSLWPLRSLLCRCRAIVTLLLPVSRSLPDGYRFAPDELRYHCSREWTSDPGQSRAHAYLREGAQLPCWRTCWTQINAVGGEAARHCTAPCGSEVWASGIEWRQEFDRELAAFSAAPGIGRDFNAAMEFVPKGDVQFFWGIY